MNSATWPALDRILRRRDALTEKLRALIPELGELVPIEAALAAADGAEVEGVADEYLNDLKTTCEFHRDAGAPFAAMVHEWYWAGDPEGIEALAYLYESCEMPEAYSGTDLVKLGEEFALERDADFSGDHERGGLSLDPLFGLWSAEHRPAFDEFEHEELAVRARVSEVEGMFTELFQLLFYEALAQASRALVDTDEFELLQLTLPFRFFAQRHERWPVLLFEIGETD